MYRKLSPIALGLYVYLCGTPPPDLDLSPTWPTAHGPYAVDLPALAEPVPVNRLHAWKARGMSPSGQPALNAESSVDGGIPQHGCGLPTRFMSRANSAMGAIWSRA